MSNQNFNYKTILDFQPIYRQINIDILIGDKVLIPNIKNIKKGNNFIFNKKYWNIIQKYKDSCVITGSLSLKAFGLISRDPSDIDLILMDGSEEPTNLVKRKYSGDEIDLHGSLMDSGYIIDFFKNPNINIIECDGFKFQNPIDVLLTKSKLLSNRGPYKDYEDIKESLIKLKYLLPDD